MLCCEKKLKKRILCASASDIYFNILYKMYFCLFQSYATLSRGNKSITTCSPVSAQQAIQLPMGVSLLSPSNHNQSLVTSSLSEYRFRPEVVTTSNRIQESCI